jgi:hypothetical protein
VRSEDFERSWESENDGDCVKVVETLNNEDIGKTMENVNLVVYGNRTKLVVKIEIKKRMSCKGF